MNEMLSCEPMPYVQVWQPRKLPIQPCARSLERATDASMMQVSFELRIRSPRPGDAHALCAAINSVAAEKWVLASTQFSPDEIRSFLEQSLSRGLPYAIAVIEGEVVGWCDIVTGKLAHGFGHLGRLGMGVRREWRRRGIGRRLLSACLQQAREQGIEKIELEVYRDNEAALRLYESFGFAREGVRSRARKLEGRYQDIVLMALWLKPPAEGV